MSASQQEFKCIFCHRLSDETTCSSCGSECRKRKNAQLLQNALRWSSACKKTKFNVPKQLQSLVKKCPQWEERIVALVESSENYRHFTYKEMEQEITGREILRCTWKMLEGKANNLVNGIQSRSDKLDKSTSCPLSEQTNFDSSIENKVADFKRLVDIFLFGGEVYLRSRSTKCTTKGLLEWKDKASKMRDVSLHEELVGYFNDATAFKTFLAYELPEITEAVRMKATIKREYNLDLQAKGVAGARTRANAKRKRDERMLAMGEGKTAFVPLVKTFLRVRGEIDKKQNHSIDGKSEGEGEGEGDDYGIKEDTCNEVGKEIISDDDMLEKSHEQDEEEEKVEEKDEQDEEEEKVEEEEYEQDEEEEKVEEEDEQKEEEEKVEDEDEEKEEEEEEEPWGEWC